MQNLSILDVATFEHLELDSETHSWVRAVNHCFHQDTIVENCFQPGLYISLLGQCQYSPLGQSNEPHCGLAGNFNYHYTVALADEPCLSRILFPSNSTWQSLSIMLPLDQLYEFGINTISELESHFRPEARLSECGTISADLLRCCESVWDCDFQGLERQLFIKAKALEILSLFLHQRRQCHQSRLPTRLSQLSDALNHIENHLHQDWTLPALARLAASNQTYIKQDIKDLLGISFRKWLLKKRVAAALELLSTNEAISHIAEETGFKSQAYFSTMFKSEVGMTPREYRQALLMQHSA